MVLGWCWGGEDSEEAGVGVVRIVRRQVLGW